MRLCTHVAIMHLGKVAAIGTPDALKAGYPIAITPAWLRAIAYTNPLTYEVDGLRALMLGSGLSLSGLTLDFVILLVATTVLVCIGGWLYPRVTV